MLHPLFDSQLAERCLTQAWGAAVAQQLLDLVRRCGVERHGHLTRWRHAIEALRGHSFQLEADRPAPRWSLARPLEALQREAIRAALLQLAPWRKGPFEIAEIELDAEWRSDLKWQRVAPHLPLAGARVLDVGCGNGYYCLRAWGAGARLVVGVDPTLSYVAQWAALQALGAPAPIVVLPLGVEALQPPPVFDCVLSMGVLYHRRSPLEHLLQLRQLLAPGGALLLESLVVDGVAGYSLVPADRYAGMRNVWFVPSVGTLKQWLRRCGFEAIRVLDERWTTAAEQRATPWSGQRSLSDVLNPVDPRRTIEGYPAPRRAALLARAR